MVLLSAPSRVITLTPSTRRSSAWLCSAPCSDKAANGNLIVVDKIAADEFKTKTVVAFLAAVGAGKKNLILNDTADVKFVASAANIPGVKTAVDGVNTYDVVNADKLIVSLDAAKKLEEVYA